MQFLSHAVWSLLQPGHLLLLLFVGGWVLALFEATRRIGLWLGGLATVLLVVVALLPVGAMLLRPLENRFPGPVALEKVDGIVILGGGQNARVTVDRGRIALNDNGERLIEGAALILTHPEAEAIFTGGNGIPGQTEADVARKVFEVLGLDTDRIHFEAEATNTYDNAVLTRVLADPQPGETWLLVTSSWHMPRAVACFRAAGWDIVPFPVDYRHPAEGGAVFTPGLDRNLRDLAIAMREYIGLAAYRMMGRTTELFPRP